MYSPKISEELIPILYRIAKALKKPMTGVVNELIRESLPEYEAEHLHGTKLMLCPLCSKPCFAKDFRQGKVKLNGKPPFVIAVCKKCFEKYL